MVEKDNELNESTVIDDKEVTNEESIETVDNETVEVSNNEEVVEATNDGLTSDDFTFASDENAEEENLDGLFRFVDEDPSEAEKITAPRYSYWKSVFRVFFKKKTNWIALGILAILLIMTYIYGTFEPFSIYDRKINTNIMYQQLYNLSPAKSIEIFGFSLKWIFGTGGNGESLFDYIWAGSRTSLSLAIICAAINMTVGIIVGAIWGFSKKIDAIMMEVYNVIANVPYILLVSVLVLILGSGFWPFVFALTITGWLGIAYFIRTQVLIIRDREYNLASKCLGTGIWKITIHNILPFMTSVIVTILATEVPSYISYEVFLSYLGVGLTADTPSLGRLIEKGQSVMRVYPVQFWAPVTVAALLTIILYVVGQNLADASDPRTHM